MYYSRIEAAAAVTSAAHAPKPSAMAMAAGFAVLALGVPLIAARLLVYGLGRSIGNVAKLAGIIGAATLEAARIR